MITLLDKIAQLLMALGIFLIFEPYWASGLKYGFFVTLFGTLLHIVTSHLLSPQNK